MIPSRRYLESTDSGFMGGLVVTATMVIILVFVADPAMGTTVLATVKVGLREASQGPG